MKVKLSIAFILIILLHSCSDNLEIPEETNNNINTKIETTFYNKSGDAVAYHVGPGEEQVIYLWDGQPTSYIIIDSDAIFGFNGNFLGWYISNVVYDVEGEIVGFEKGALNIQTKSSTLKNVKLLKPLKTTREIKPVKPIFSNNWSPIKLDSFFLSGID